MHIAKCKYCGKLLHKGDEAFFADLDLEGVDSVFCSKECMTNEAEKQISVLQRKIWTVQNQKFTQEPL